MEIQEIQKEMEQAEVQLRKELGEGVKTVTFTKKNGENRIMKCTTNIDVILENSPDFETPTKEVPKKPGLLRVWDLDVEDWRSFNMYQVTDIK